MTERIDERLQAMGVDASGMTDEQKFTAATGLTRYNEYEANNAWYVPGGAANVPAGASEPTGEGGNTGGNTSTTEPTGPTGEPEVETYTAEEAAAYNAQLPGAVKAGDVQTPAVEGQEAVEAKNAVYSFESFNNEEKEVKYGEGTVEVIELREDGATVKVIENESTDPNAADFTNLEFNVNSLDETATLQLFSTEGLAQPIWVTFEKVSDAVEGQEAIAAQDAVLYTEETAAAYNAELEGAVKEGDPKTSSAEIVTE